MKKADNKWLSRKLFAFLLNTVILTVAFASAWIPHTLEGSVVFTVSQLINTAIYELIQGMMSIADIKSVKVGNVEITKEGANNGLSNNP